MLLPPARPARRREHGLPEVVRVLALRQTRGFLPKEKPNPPKTCSSLRLAPAANVFNFRLDIPLTDIKPDTKVSPPIEPRPDFAERVGAYRILWCVGLVVFTLDQLSKIWISAILRFPTYWPEEGAITIVNGFFHLVHVGNTGAAWSLLSGRSTFLALLAAVTLLGIFYGRRHLGLRARQAQFAFGLLCGGIVGNFTDRLLHGHVIDFLDFHFGSYIYPTFNIADAGICIGVILYLWHSCREPSA